MKKLFFFAIATTMVVTSCCAPSYVIYREAEGRNIEPTQAAVVTPLVAELEVITELSISNVVDFDVLVTTDVVRDIENYKRIALLETAKKYKADTMLGALISVDTNDKGLLVVTVMGYPARYKNFRSMKQEDLWISNYNASNTKTNANTEEKPSLLNIFNKK